MVDTFEGGVEYHVHAFDAKEPGYIIRVYHPPSRATRSRQGWVARKGKPEWVRDDQQAYSVDPQTSNSAITIDRRYALALLERWGGEPDEWDRIVALEPNGRGPVLEWVVKEFGP